MRSRATTVSIDRAENEQTVGQTSHPAPENSEIAGPSSSRHDQKITVVISDASQMTSELLARALGRMKTLNILKSAVTSEEALEAIVDLEPDVAVVSTHQADGLCKGFEIVRQARQMFVKTRCVLLMDDSDHELVIDAFRAGARGVFKRSASMNLLGRCISAVHSGQIWASSADLQQVF